MITLQTAVLALAVSGGGGGETVLLDFSAEWCVPCQQMMPSIRELVARGYPVQTVDFDENRDLAAKYGVDLLPTFVMLVDGKVVDRVTGGTSFSRLERMCKMGQAARRAEQPPVRPGPNLSPEQFPGPLAGAPRLNPSVLPDGVPRPGLHDDGAAGGFNDLIAATVRLRVEENGGHSCGSGTIIDARRGEALILTCAHIFRDSEGKGAIEVDLFAAGKFLRAAGYLLRYDLKTDLALVTIHTPGPVQVARVAPVGYRASKGDRVVNVGCNNGDVPTARIGRVTSIDKYLGPPNLQVSGAPVQGRSGGGLFSADGLVIGVCNAADPTENEGLYTALTALHDELRAADLLDFCLRNGEGLAENVPPASAHPPRMPKEMPNAMDIAGVPDASPPSVGSRAGVPSTESAGGLSGEEEAALEEIRRQKSEGAEVVCVIRSRSDPLARSEIIVLDNVSSAFLEQLALESRVYTPNEEKLTSLTVRDALETDDAPGDCADRTSGDPNTLSEPETSPATTARRADPSTWEPYWR